MSSGNKNHRYAIGMSNQKGRHYNKSFENILDFKTHAPQYKLGFSFPLRNATKSPSFKTLSPKSSSPRGDLKIFTYRKTVTSPLRQGLIHVTEEAEACENCPIERERWKVAEQKLAKLHKEYSLHLALCETEKNNLKIQVELLQKNNKELLEKNENLALQLQQKDEYIAYLLGRIKVLEEHQCPIFSSPRVPQQYKQELKVKIEVLAEQVRKIHQESQTYEEIQEKQRLVVLKIQKETQASISQKTAETQTNLLKKLAFTQTSTPKTSSSVSQTPILALTSSESQTNYEKPQTSDISILMSDSFCQVAPSFISQMTQFTQEITNSEAQTEAKNQESMTQTEMEPEMRSDEEPPKQEPMIQEVLIARTPLKSLQKFPVVQMTILPGVKKQPQSCQIQAKMYQIQIKPLEKNKLKFEKKLEMQIEPQVKKVEILQLAALPPEKKKPKKSKLSSQTIPQISIAPKKRRNLQLVPQVCDIKIKPTKKNLVKKPPVIEEGPPEDAPPDLPPKKPSCCSDLCHYLFMLFDGFEAFQCDESKLARLRGNKPTCRDKCAAWKQFSMGVLMFIAMMWVMMVEMMKINQVKSQTCRVEGVSKVSYNISEEMNFVAVAYLQKDQITEKEKLCQKISVQYIQTEEWEPVDHEDEYSLRQIYDFQCFLQPWNSEFYALTFNLGAQKDTRVIGKELDSREYKNEHHTELPDGLDFSIFPDTEILQFVSESNYNNEILFKFEIEGVNSYIEIFNVFNKTELEFGTEEKWDQFRYSNNTDLLYQSEEFILGTESLSLARLHGWPEKHIHIGQNTRFNFLGMPINYGDEEHSLINFEKTQETNYENKVSKIGEPSPRITIPFHFDFSERLYEYNYYDIFDFITAMGGFKGFIDPIMALIIPLFCMSFQRQLAQILKERNSDSIRKDQLENLKNMKKQIQEYNLDIPEEQQALIDENIKKMEEIQEMPTKTKEQNDKVQEKYEELGLEQQIAEIQEQIQGQISKAKGKFSAGLDNQKEFMQNKNVGNFKAPKFQFEGGDQDDQLPAFDLSMMIYENKIYHDYKKQILKIKKKRREQDSKEIMGKIAERTTFDQIYEFFDREEMNSCEQEMLKNQIKTLFEQNLLMWKYIQKLTEKIGQKGFYNKAYVDQEERPVLLS